MPAAALRLHSRCTPEGKIGRDDRIRTCDSLTPSLKSSTARGGLLKISASSCLTSQPFVRVDCRLSGKPCQAVPSGAPFPQDRSNLPRGRTLQLGARHHAAPSSMGVGQAEARSSTSSGNRSHCRAASVCVKTATPRLCRCFVRLTAEKSRTDRKLGELHSGQR